MEPVSVSDASTGEVSEEVMEPVSVSDASTGEVSEEVIPAPTEPKKKKKVKITTTVMVPVEEVMEPVEDNRAINDPAPAAVTEHITSNSRNVIFDPEINGGHEKPKMQRRKCMSKAVSEDSTRAVAVEGDDVSPTNTVSTSTGSTDSSPAYSTTSEDTVSLPPANETAAQKTKRENQAAHALKLQLQEKARKASIEEMKKKARMNSILKAEEQEMLKKKKEIECQSEKSEKFNAFFADLRDRPSHFGTLTAKYQNGQSYPEAEWLTYAMQYWQNKQFAHALSSKTDFQKNLVKFILPRKPSNSVLVMVSVLWNSEYTEFQIRQALVKYQTLANLESWFTDAHMMK